MQLIPISEKQLSILSIRDQNNVINTYMSALAPINPTLEAIFSPVARSSDSTSDISRKFESQLNVFARGVRSRKTPTSSAANPIVDGDSVLSVNRHFRSLVEKTIQTSFGVEFQLPVGFNTPEEQRYMLSVLCRYFQIIQDKCIRHSIPVNFCLEKRSINNESFSNQGGDVPNKKSGKLSKLINESSRGCLIIVKVFVLGPKGFEVVKLDNGHRYISKSLDLNSAKGNEKEAISMFCSSNLKEDEIEVISFRTSETDPPSEDMSFAKQLRYPIKLYINGNPSSSDKSEAVRNLNKIKCSTEEEKVKLRDAIETLIQDDEFHYLVLSLSGTPQN